MSVKCLDVFSGAGGLTEGFMSSEFEIISHIEMDSDACLTLQTRISYHYLKEQNKLDIYKDYLEEKITRDELYYHVPTYLLESVINDEISENTFKDICRKIESRLEGKKIDLIFGGPPCQAYSLVGRARDKHSMKFDKRKYLYIEYIKYLKRYKPKYFIFENVKGLLSSKDENNQLIIDKMRSDFLQAGYKFEYRILNSKYFGVLQSRERVVIMGYKKHLKFSYPEFNSLEPQININELFSDLPKIKNNQSSKKYSYDDSSYYRSVELDILTQHEARLNNDRDLSIYKLAAKKWNKGTRIKYTDIPKDLQTHNNTKSFLDRYKVVNGNGISHTVVAHIAKDGHYYIHPDIKQNRSITVREAARIQSFPDDYYFEKCRTSAFRQIGNAVPPLMAKEISKKILELF